MKRRTFLGTLIASACLGLARPLDLVNRQGRHVPPKWKAPTEGYLLDDEWIAPVRWVTIEDLEEMYPHAAKILQDAT